MSLRSLRDRNIAPNWRSLQETINNRELNDLIGSPNKINWNYPKYSFVIDQWNKFRSISTASDLVQTFNANGLPLNQDILNACEFLVDSAIQDVLPKLYASACSILKRASMSVDSCHTDNPHQPVISAQLIKNELICNVRESRQKLFSNPESSIRHLDLARAHMCLGNHDKAIRYIRDAVSLAPDNRYVTRCAVKGYLHLGCVKDAYDTLRRNNFRNDDPWLLAASIAIDLARGTTVRTDVKRVRNIIADPLINPFSISELASSLATLDAREPTARTKDIRHLISTSLIDPIDNALAQAQWLSYKEPSFEVSIPSQNTDFGYEYLTFNLEMDKKYEEALNQSYLWLRDIPFSRRAALECSNILSIHFKSNQKAIDILELGLTANPNAEDLLNNAAYLYVKEGKIPKAIEKIIIAFKKEIINEDTLICLFATTGLISFRLKDIESGKKYYESALEIAKKRKKKDYVDNAMLNYLREQFMANLITKYQLESALRDMNIKHPRNKSLLEEIISETGITL